MVSELAVWERRKAVADVANVTSAVRRFILRACATDWDAQIGGLRRGVGLVALRGASGMLSTKAIFGSVVMDLCPISEGLVGSGWSRKDGGLWEHAGEQR